MSVTLRSARVAAIALVAGGPFLAGCGDDGDDAVVGPATSVERSAAAPDDDEVDPSSTTSTTAAAGEVIELQYQDGSVVGGPKRAQVEVGEEVTIRVQSDVAEEVHVHTYDLRADIPAGGTREITFTASIPGVHEVDGAGAVLLLGHVAGVVLAHDRALALFPKREVTRSQYPLLGTMVLFTVGGLALLLGA